jgi:hypothetical protein
MVVIFTLSLYCSVHPVDDPPDVSTIYIVFSLYAVYYFSINLSAFTEIFMFIGRILIKIVIT